MKGFFCLPTLSPDRVLREQLKAIKGDGWVSLPGVGFAGLVSCGSLAFLLETPAVLWWLLPYSLACAATGYCIATTDADPRQSDLSLRKQAQVLMVCAALLGLAWGLLGWATLLAKGPGNEAALAWVWLGLFLASTFLSCNPCLPISISGLMCMWFPIALLFATRSGWQDKSPAIGSLIFLASLYANAWWAERRFTDTLETRWSQATAQEKLSQQAADAELALRRAEATRRAQTQFLAFASHDLRQPVHALDLFLESLARTKPNAEQQILLGYATAASAATRDLLNTLLDYSRLEAGAVKAHWTVFKLGPLLQRLERELAPLANQKNLVYRSRETTLAVEADAGFVELILRNLIINAIKYTEQGGMLIGVRKRNRHIVIEVWDTGIGLRPEHRQVIFEQFRQIQTPTPLKSRGLGLGLTIAQGMAQAIGSRIRVESQPGQGSVFRLSLRRATQPVFNDFESEFYPPPPPLGRRALVIDDDSLGLTAMGLLLQSWGYECVCARDRHEALQLCQRRPHVLISDYELENQDTGWAVVQYLRSHFQTEIPALIITGDTTPRLLREANLIHAELIHKPVSSNLLRKILYALLSPMEYADEDQPRANQLQTQCIEDNKHTENRPQLDTADRKHCALGSACHA
jgi:signal transduction histidine kinase/CheY-like chemotaxis protein